MKETTAERLQKIMNERNLKAVEVLELCKPYSEKYGVNITKGQLSEYLHGVRTPKQDKVFILAKALSVSETYLMGFEEQPKEPIRTPVPKIPKEEPPTRCAFSFDDKVELFDFDDNPNDELFADDNEDNIIPHRRLPKLDFLFGDTPQKPHREHPFDLARRIDQQDMCTALFAQLDDDDRDEIIEIMEIKLKKAKYQ